MDFPARKQPCCFSLKTQIRNAAKSNLSILFPAIAMIRNGIRNTDIKFSEYDSISFENI